MQAPLPAVPGRLRLRFTQLKQQTAQLTRMAEALRAVSGVILVETSPLTGGLLVHYDAVIGKTTAFWDQIEAVLLAHQLVLDPRPLGRHEKGGANKAQPAERETSSSDGARRPAARPRHCYDTGPRACASGGK